MHTPADRFWTIDGLRFHGLDWGDGPPIVLLHAGSATAHAWDRVAPRLAERNRVIALDARDHGDSDVSRVPGEPLTLVNDVMGVVDTLGLNRFGLIGNSMGGRTAMAIAGLYPDRVDRLVVEDVGPGLDAGGQAFVAKVAANRQATFASRDAVLAWLRGLRPHADAAWLDEQIDAVSVPLADGSRANKARQHLAPPPATLPPLDYWDLWARITCPTLIVRGVKSPIISDAILDRMIGTLPAARSVTVSQAAHHPHEDNLAAFLDVVLPFFGITYPG